MTYLLFGMVIGILFTNTVSIFTLPTWSVEESPVTHKCYEVRSTYHWLGRSRSISPIDASFCNVRR